METVRINGGHTRVKGDGVTARLLREAPHSWRVEIARRPRTDAIYPDAWEPVADGLSYYAAAHHARGAVRAAELNARHARGAE